MKYLKILFYNTSVMISDMYRMIFLIITIVMLFSILRFYDKKRIIDYLIELVDLMMMAGIIIIGFSIFVSIVIRYRYRNESIGIEYIRSKVNYNLFRRFSS